MTQPAKLLRVAAMADQLLEELQRDSLGEAARVRVDAASNDSLDELRSVLSDDLRHELDRLAGPRRHGRTRHPTTSSAWPKPSLPAGSTPPVHGGVESVTQLDDTHLRWVADIGGARREWTAEISEQHPEERVAWHATEGATNAGAVTFHRLDDDTTRVMLQLEFDPDGVTEQAGDKLGFVRRRAK